MLQIEKLRKISPNDGYHYFFGYYDLYPYNKNGDKHLVHRVKFADRLPTKEDVCEVGYIEVNARKFVRLAETTAWNFQQGALLNWFSEDSIVYNSFEDGKLCSIVKDLNGDTRQIFPVPLACLSADRKWGISVNFARIYAFRPGYGYVAAIDPNVGVNAPDNDGIFLVNLQNGEIKLLVSYAEMIRRFPEKPYTDQELVVNHVTFNPSATKYLFLLRNNAKNGEKWGTQMLIGDLQGDLKKMTDYEVNSHYAWKNDNEFMIWSVLKEGAGIYFFNAETGERKRLYNEITDRDDIHCWYNSDASEFIGDSYPFVDGYRHIFRYNFAQGQAEDLIQVQHREPKIMDIRCDLHARYRKDGKVVSFDSYHEQCRGIYELTLKE